MIFGPIFTYEMITSGRRARYFLLRAFYAVVLFIILFMTYQESIRYHYRSALRDDANVASQFFVVMAFAQILAVIFVGPAMAAGTLAVERERRTIEYLFATDLTNAEIVLGKLLARLIHLSFLVLVGLPILSIAMLMGGIAPALLAQVFVITLSTMVFVITLSIGVSACSSHSRNTTVGVLFLLLLLYVSPLILSGIASSLDSSWVPHFLNVASEQLYGLNPLNSLIRILNHKRYGGMGSAWSVVGRLVGFQLILSALIASGAVWGLRRIHLNAVQGESKKRKSTPHSPRRQGPGDWAMLWKECYVSTRSRSAGRVAKIFRRLLILGIGVLMVWVSWKLLSESQGYYRGAAMQMAIVLSCVWLLALGSRSASLITMEKEKDTWLTLLSTPMSPREILVSKLAANLYAYCALPAVVAYLWILEIIQACRASSTIRAYDSPISAKRLVVAAGASFFTTLLLGCFVSLMGVAFSLRAKNSSRAVGATLGTLFMLGGGMMLCCMPILSGEGEGNLIFLSPIMPYLISIPLFFVGPDVPRYNSEQEWMKVAWVLGNLGYLVASVILYGMTIGGFGEATGRHEAYSHPSEPELARGGLDSG